MNNLKLYNLVHSFRNAVDACLSDGDSENDLSSILKMEIREYLQLFEKQLEKNGYCDVIVFKPSYHWDLAKPSIPEALMAERSALELTGLLHEINGFAGNHLCHVEFVMMAIHYEIAKRFISRSIQPEQPQLQPVQLELKVFNDDDSEDGTFDCIRCGDTRTKDEYYSHSICAYCAHVTR